MFGGDRHGIEEHQHDDEPIEPLCLYGVSNPEPQSLLCTPKALALARRFHFGLQEACWYEKEMEKENEIEADMLVGRWTKIKWKRFVELLCFDFQAIASRFLKASRFFNFLKPQNRTFVVMLALN